MDGLEPVGMRFKERLPTRRVELNARDALQMLLKEVENEESLLLDYVMCVGYQ